MPNGLCMFAPDGRLAVINNRFTANDGLVQRSGASSARPFSEVVSACVSARLAFTAKMPTTIVSEIKGSQSRRNHHHQYAQCRSERALSWNFQPMAGGGTVVLVEDITERRNAEARINHMARFDELTGLPNRRQFPRSRSSNC